MNVIRFIDILQSYGAQPERWPEADRGAALEFAEKFEDAKVLLSEARALDAALSTLRCAPPSEQLRIRIMDAAIPALKAANDKLPYRAIAASLVAGLMIGVLTSLSPSVPSDNGLYAQSGGEEINYSDAEIDYSWMSETFEDGKL